MRETIPAGLSPYRAMARRARAFFTPQASRRFFRAAAIVAMLLAPSASWATVAGTKHNFGLLSAAGVKSADSSEICVFCHTPHNADPQAPLWNRAMSNANYRM